MLISLDKFIANPVFTAGYLLLLAAAAVALSGILILLSSVFYNPDITLISRTDAPVQKIDSGAIGARNFFGFADAKPEIAVDDLPETKLELTLRGAFAGSNEQNAGAIIENNDTQISNHYAVGEALPGEATLKAIYPDRVVLARNGLLETLYFPDISDATGIGAIKNVSPTGTASPGTSEEAKKRREAIRERIKQLRNR